MATYTLTLSRNYANATYYNDSIIAKVGTAATIFTPTSITPPVWKGGLRTFLGYWAPNGTFQSINADGTYNFTTMTSDGTHTERWSDYAYPTTSLSLNSGTCSVLEITYINGSFLQWGDGEAFDATHPIPIPTRECYRFLGFYSTNATTGTLYIDSNGYPTSSFSQLSSASTTIYAQWERVSYKLTVNHSSGSPASTVFYAQVGVTGEGRFFSDGLCTTQITSITPPTRELYRWEGSWSTTWTSSSAVQYITTSGSFTSSFYSLSITADKTFSYANNWTQLSVKLTLKGSSWNIPQSTYYIDKTNGGVYSDWLLTTPLSTLPIPSQAGYRFLGYYNASSTSSPGTQYVDGDGNILSALTALKTAKTIYAQGRAATYTISLNHGSGTSSTNTIYYDATSGSAAFFSSASAVITSVPVPVYTGNSFLGYYSAEQSGTLRINTNGSIVSSWVPSSDDTIYAHWGIDVSVIDVNTGSGSGGTTRFWYRASVGKFFSDNEFTTEITSISVPSLRLHTLNGLYTSAGALAVNSSGVIQSGFTPSDEFVEITASYTRFAYEMLFSGGSLSYSAIYRATGTSTWYTSESMATTVSNVGVPVRNGYTFNGYSYGGTSVIDSSGNILSAATIDQDYTADAQWSANTYTLTFNGNGATPSFFSKTVTYGIAIGELPTLSNIPAKKSFDEWQVNGSGITAESIWSWAGSQTAIVKWISYFGEVKDWFNLSSANLIPESSESGDSNSHHCAYNATSEAATTETSAIWRNPVVKYRVVGDMTLNVILGTAYPATNWQRAKPTISGYMISSVSVRTAIGEAPEVTISAVANEGYSKTKIGTVDSYTVKATPSIKTYSLSIPLSSRHRPQNLLSAFSMTNAGELQEVTLSAAADPVVVAENGLPCASDLCHGRIEVAATIAAFEVQDYPTAASDFTLIATDFSNNGIGYKTQNVVARKEIT